MPPVPKFLEIFGKIRTNKILLETNAKHFRHTYSDVNTTSKVAIELYSIKYHAKKHKATVVGVSVPDNSFNSYKDSVCNNQLLEKSPQHSGETTFDSVPGKVMLGKKAGLQIVKSANWSLYQLRKKRYKACQTSNIFLCPILATIDIDGIAHRHKYIKRNTHRKGYVPKAKYCIRAS